MFFSGLQQGYSKSISQDIQNVGTHILAIPKGCPYEATATLLHGGILPKQLPEETLDRIEGIDNVRSAYSTLIGILPSVQVKEKTDRVAGVTRSINTMKNGWSDISTEKLEEFFKKGKSVVLGSNIAIEYGLKVGDKIKIKSPDSEFSILHILPETKSKDDQSIFVPLFLAQPLTHLIGLLYKTYISSNVVLINLKTVSIPFVITLLSVTLSSIYPIYLSNSKKPIVMLHDNVNL